MKLFLLIFLPVLLLSACSSNEAGTDSQKAAYSIDNNGSDTIVNLALAWAEKYQSEHPDVSVAVTGGGSGTGIAALINKTTNIANASRQIKKEEVAEAQKNGVDPVEHTIAPDAIAVIVNPDNPVSQLTMQQISDIYSGKINNWSEVGGEDRPIVRLSREVGTRRCSRTWSVASWSKASSRKEATKVTENTYGKSITDPCLGWKDAEKLIRDLAEMV